MSDTSPTRSFVRIRWLAEPLRPAAISAHFTGSGLPGDAPGSGMLRERPGDRRDSLLASLNAKP